MAEETRNNSENRIDENLSLAEFNEQLRAAHAENNAALQLVYQISGMPEFKIAHLLLRIRNQLLKGSKGEKKAFFQWIRSLCRADAEKELNLEYNPLYRLIPHLSEVKKQMQKLATISRGLFREADGVHHGRITKPIELPEDYSFLTEKYDSYDVIILGVIDYDFRYQRPQHIADYFVDNGHRVFYINAIFSKDKTCVTNLKNRLNVITLPCLAADSITVVDTPAKAEELYPELEKLIVQYGIRDSMIFTDYPTWINIALELRNKYGFPLLCDYMDDYTGFSDSCSPYLKACCEKILKKSDVVIASSSYLATAAKCRNTNVHLIRNGAEYAHFQRAFAATDRKTKQIGYYGAVAEWFDEEKVEVLAGRFPECEIVIIGNITNDRVLNWNYKNVVLKGEIPYSELPDHLQNMDVCIIPFDASTPLIQATDPVKFYEYLSAGKKVVATEIPELLPYKNRFVYLENDNDAFAERVRQCLEGSDCLASPEECAAFAAENDWQVRVNGFKKAAEAVWDKISIIVLCYNQLEYTKQCVTSILENTAYPNYELILVDNASTDGTAEYILAVAAQVSRIVPVLNKTNRGFAGGNNDGINASSGKYIVLLNNDTLVTRGWLTAMRKHFRNNEDSGIVGAVTNSIGNEAKIPVEYDELKDMPRFAYAYTAKNMNHTYPHDGVLAMFCVMFPKRMVDIIGPLDEHYGLGMFEDDDYSYAAVNAGYQLILPEDVFIHHFGSVSFNKMNNAAYRELFERNKMYFQKKWDIDWKEHHYRAE